MKIGVAVLHSRPYHPQSRGKNERLHRALNAEVLAQVAIRPRGGDGQYGIFYGACHIASIDLTQPQGVNHVSERVSTMSAN